MGFISGFVVLSRICMPEGVWGSFTLLSYNKVTSRDQHLFSLFSPSDSLFVRFLSLCQYRGKLSRLKVRQNKKNWGGGGEGEKGSKSRTFRSAGQCASHYSSKALEFVSEVFFNDKKKKSLFLNGGNDIALDSPGPGGTSLILGGIPDEKHNKNPGSKGRLEARPDNDHIILCYIWPILAH